MAISKPLIASFLLSLLLLHLGHANQTNGDYTSPAASAGPTAARIDCGGACLARCSLSKRPRLCQRACGSCCTRCNCVPPGASGNYDACPCYASLTTHGNRRKCP